MTSDYTDPQGATRLAIEFLSLWIEPDRQAAATHIKEALDASTGPNPEFSAIAGLLNLSQFLLAEVVKANGASSAEDYDRLAREYLSRMSINLP
ncbi:hypothetical protein [Streptomyces sp. NPDC059593]|uniref:hypothetical protein n=1 Tax=Streptomyces sp. NPDC059593 TaxID=3346878 RepID=UPI0036928F77